MAARGVTRPLKALPNKHIGDTWTDSTTGATLVFNGKEWENIKAQESQMDRIERKLNNVMERLAILDNPSPRKLAQFETLKDTYIKYKFIEKLCGEEQDGNDR